MSERLYREKERERTRDVCFAKCASERGGDDLFARCAITSFQQKRRRRKEIIIRANNASLCIDARKTRGADGYKYLPCNLPVLQH